MSLNLKTSNQNENENVRALKTNKQQNTVKIKSHFYIKINHKLDTKDQSSWVELWKYQIM